MKFSKLLFLGALLGAKVASAVVVDFSGLGTYRTYNYSTSAFVWLPFSVTFSYDSSTPVIDSYPTQKTFAALSLGLTVGMTDGSTWTHTQNSGVRMTMDNALNGGSVDSLTISTGFFTEAQSLALPRWNIAGVDYRVTNFSFQIAENSGGLFPDGDFSLPPSPTFMGSDLSGYDRLHAKLYIMGPSGFDQQAFDHRLTTLGAPAAVPEPSTWAAILGASALGVVVWQRRRAKQPLNG